MRASVLRTCLLLSSLVLCSCSTYIYVDSPWPRLDLPENQKSTVTYKASDLDPLGPEKKAEVMNETMALVLYIKTLEATINAYMEEQKKHNTQFREKIIKKETSR